MEKTMKMMTTTGVLLTVLFFILYQHFNTDILFTFTVTFFTASYHFVMRLSVGMIVNALMNNHADYYKKWYRLLPLEKKFYTFINIQKWKDKMPTYDETLFSLKHHSLEEIAQAMCQSEVVHEIIVLLSFIPLLFTYYFGSFPIFLMTSLLSAAFDMIFVMMQRYNRPRIIKLIEYQNKRSKTTK